MLTPEELKSAYDTTHTLWYELQDRVRYQNAVPYEERNHNLLYNLRLEQDALKMAGSILHGHYMKKRFGND